MAPPFDQDVSFDIHSIAFNESFVSANPEDTFEDNDLFFQQVPTYQLPSVPISQHTPPSLINYQDSSPQVVPLCDQTVPYTLQTPTKIQEQSIGRTISRLLERHPYSWKLFSI